MEPRAAGPCGGAHCRLRRSREFLRCPKRSAIALLESTGDRAPPRLRGSILRETTPKDKTKLLPAESWSRNVNRRRKEMGEGVPGISDFGLRISDVGTSTI